MDLSHGAAVLPLLTLELKESDTTFPLRSEKEDFIDCVRTRHPTLEPAEVGHRVTSLCHLGHIAIHTGRKLRWDPDRESFLNDPQAQAYLTTPIQAPPTV
ncbi:MAG: hypothetical protein HYV60_07310 [Planctomycetia bacterium]|nr:hypothetical protein [Planctomycetia bacterium]